MCGIAGEFIFDPAGRVDPDLIQPLANILRHRGPDEWGYHLGCGGRALLINTRLSIVDLANGKQPISNEDGSIWVTLNGEIYGFAEQKKELQQKGHRFRTRTDTEVIVHLYEEYGENFVDHLRGEFAVAVLDENRELLFLVRDRFGIKPLFYSELPGELMFASEVKAILRHPKARRKLQRESVFHLLHGLLMPGETYFEGVRDLEPGHLLRVSRSGIVKRRYWDLPFVPEASAHADEEEAAEELSRLLFESVRLRLHGDVEVGVFFSGGLDSSSVAAAVAEISGRAPKLFTIAFTNPNYDESPGAGRFAAERGMEHHLVPIGPGDLGPGFERSIWHAEMPVLNSHGVAKMLLSELARRYVKVILSGEGADEALAGYNSYRHLMMLEALRLNPKDAAARADLNKLLNNFSLHSGTLPFRSLISYDRVTSLFGAYPYYVARAQKIGGAAKRVLARDFRRAVENSDPVAEMAERIGIGKLAGLGPVSAQQYYFFKTDLANYILVCMGDRMEMAHSIEGRTPFLDHKLVEFACSLPQSFKVRGQVGKYILRKAMSSRMPAAPAIVKRPLMGPSAETLGLDRRSGFLSPYLERKVVQDAGIFDPLAVSALRYAVRFLRRGTYAHGVAESVLTIIASTHVLHRLYCERFEDSAARFSVAPVDRSVPVAAM